MKRCPYCAAEVKLSAAECPSCGKAIGGKKTQDDRPGFTNLDTYEKKVVPWWLFVIVVGISLLTFALMFFG